MKIIIFDVETTGLLLPSVAEVERQPHIIELGARAVDESGAVLGEFSQLLKPPISLPAVITKITGLTDADLAGAPTFKQVLPALANFFRGSDLLIAHNAPFDVTMLFNELVRAQCVDFPWPARNLCTAEEFTALFGRRPRLLELYERIVGEPLVQTHRALGDVDALHKVLMKSGALVALIGGK